MEPLKLVIIEDEEAHFQLMRRAISKSFPLASVHYFDEAATCVEKIGTIRPDVIIVDYLMPGMNGIEFLKSLKRENIDIPVIMTTGQGDENVAVRAMKLGAWDYLVKSSDFFALIPSIIDKVIRERKLRDSLKQVEKRFRDLSENTSDWIWELDREGKYTYSNPVVEKILGYTAEEVMDRYFYDLFPEGKRESQKRSVFDLMKEGKSVNDFVNCLVHKDGREVIVETSGVPIFDKGNKLVGYRGIDRDVTERRKAVEVLQESEERFRSIYEKSPIGIEIYDEYGQLTNANKACLDIFGVSDVREILDFKLFDDPNVPQDAMEKLRGGETVRYETPFDLNKIKGLDLYEASKSGIIYIDVLITPLRQESDISGYLVQVQDITDRKWAEEGLQISHRFLEIANKSMGLSHLLKESVTEVRKLIGCAAAAIRILDETGNIPYQAYDGFSQAFYEQESSLSIHSDQCMCIDVIKGRVDPHLPFLTEGGSFYMNGTTRFFSTLSQEERKQIRNTCNHFGYESVALIPIRLGEQILGLIHVADPDENRVPVGKVKILERAAMELGTAIQRVQAREALRKAHDELELRVEQRTLELASANKQLREEIEERTRAEEALRISSNKLRLFAYTIMHDLKSPAVGIYGLTRLLQKQYSEVIDEKGKLYCDQIVKASEHIAALVEKINLYIACKESPMEIETILLGDILQTIRDEFSMRFGARNIKWIEPETPVEIRADRVSLLRVFRNFVDNALKYGGKNLSEIRVGYKKSNGFHILSVSDDGVGIKKEDCEKIFELFQRNSNSKGIEGTGLGLSIVREIAERHHGRIWVEPGAEKGTTFYISIADNLTDTQSCALSAVGGAKA